jgi:hypothetical protein
MIVFFLFIIILLISSLNWLSYYWFLSQELGLTQVGINVPISVPLPFSSFTSCKPSFAGDLNFDGNVYIFPIFFFFLKQTCRVSDSVNFS